MALTAGTELKRPDNYAVFETNCLKLGKVMIGTTAMNKNGRRGQPQLGVDVWGWRNDNVDHIVGIQCKQKGFGQELTEREVRDEWEQALAFEPPIKEFYILTTADNDVKMEQLARQLCLELLRKSGRSVPFSVWGWGRICDELVDHPDLIKAFDPDYGIYSRQHDEKIESVIGMLERHTVQLNSLVAGTWNGGVVMFGSADDASGASEVDKILDQRIDANRTILDGGRPTTALSLFEKMLAEVEPTGSPRIVFRIKSNIGACYLALDEIQKGCQWLLAAHAHAPDEPKAISNKAFAHLLAFEFEKVLEIGREQFVPDNADVSLWSHVVQAAAQNGFVGDPLSLVPELRRQTEGVLVAAVHFDRVRGNDVWRQRAVQAHALFPGNRHARQFFADSFLDQAGKASDSWATGTISPSLRGHVEAAAETYADIWRAATSGECAVGDDEFVVLANLLVALRLLDRYPAAIELIRNERHNIVRDEGVLVRATIAAYEGGSDLAEELLPLLPRGPATAMLHLQLALRRADWNRVADLDDSLVDDVDTAEKMVFQTAIDICRIWKTSGGLPLAADLDGPIAAACGDVRASILAADMCTAFGLPETAAVAWQNGRRSVTAESHWTARVSVAKHAFRLSKWRDAADFYLGSIDKTRDSDELRELAIALAYELPQSGRGSRFFRELPPHLSKDAFFRHFEAVMLFNAGELRRAEKAARLLLKETQRLDTFKLLAMTLQRNDRLDKIRDFLKTNDVLSFDGSAHDKMVAAQVLHQVGRVPEALKELYRLYLAHRERPDIALAFFSMMMERRSFKHVPRPKVVDVDSWVRAEDDAGHVFEFIIGDDPSVAQGILSPTHSLAAQALGCAPGDTFSSPRDVGGSVVWTIKEIRHRWSHAANFIGHNFENQFPDENGVYSYTMKNGDIQPMLEMVRRHAEQNREFAKQYSDGLPLTFVAGRIHRDPISFAGYVRSLGEEIKTCLGNAQERAQAFSVIQHHRASGAVLDSYTAWTAASLDLLPALEKLFGALFIPQSVRDDLLVLKGIEKPAGKTFSIIYEDGQYLKHETTKEQENTRRKLIEEQQRKIETHCKVLAVAAPELVGDAVEERADLLDTAVQNFGSGVLDPAAIAANGYILMSEDLNYRIMASSIWPIKSVWLQPAITAAAILGIITGDEFDQKIVELARLRHGFIAVDPGLLVRSLRGGDDEAFSDFLALADFIGTRTADVLSHIGVVVTFVDAIVMRTDLRDVQCLKAISVLLENLIRHRLSIAAKILTIVLVRVSTKGQFVVARWIQGHFLEPLVDVEFQEYCRKTLPYVLGAIFGSDDSHTGIVTRARSAPLPKLPPAFAVE
jgi:tetratricopeptide (TPR) repeat protein